MTGVGETFRELADTLEAIEQSETVATDPDIRAISPQKADLLDEEQVSVEIEVLVPLIDSESIGENTDLALNDVELTGDGSLRIDLVATVNKTEKPSAESVESSPKEITDKERKPETNGEVELADGKNGIAADDPDNQSTSTSQKQPSYRDPVQLQEAYEKCDTFSEMTEELNVDVTPQTVRRYMIQHGIHEPSSRNSPSNSLLTADPNSISTSSEQDSNSDQTSTLAQHETDTPNELDTDTETSGEISSKKQQTDESNQPSEEEVVQDSLAEKDSEKHPEEPSITDNNKTHSESKKEDDAVAEQITLENIDLPDHLSLEQVRKTVRHSKTLYEAQKGLELERNEAQQLLQDLNLLNLVHGRMATREHANQTREEINRRIQSAATREHAQ